MNLFPLLTTAQTASEMHVFTVYFAFFNNFIAFDFHGNDQNQILVNKYGSSIQPEHDHISIHMTERD